MANKTQKTKVRDMKPSKDAKGGGGGTTLGDKTSGGGITLGDKTSGDHKNRHHHRGHGNN